MLLITMTSTIKNGVSIILFLMILLMNTPTTYATDAVASLDEMTGGMTGDGSTLVEEFMFWLVVICFCGCVIITVIGAATSDSDLTKKGVKGIALIILIVILFYAGGSSVEYLKSRYG